MDLGFKAKQASRVACREKITWQHARLCSNTDFTRTPLVL
jgi:hypothetical protein